MGIKRFIGPAAVAAALAAGGAAGVALTSSPAAVQLEASTGTQGTTAQSTTATASTDSTQSRDRGPHTVGSCTEATLTGDNAAKATAAAKAAVSGGTIERLETDCDGATYEAHMTKPDGSHVTVLMDKDFKVTSVEEGHGPGSPHGRHGPRDGQRQDSTTQPSSTA